MDTIENLYFHTDPNDNHPLSFPVSLLSELQERIHLDSEDVVLELGSGTSQLSPLLLHNGNRVLAVATNAAQGRFLEAQFSKYPHFNCIGKSFESISLLDQGVDHVIVVQTFPVFNLGIVKSMFKQILNPGGFVVFLWNCPDQSNRFMNRLEQLIKEHCLGSYLVSECLEARKQKVQEFFFPHSSQSFSLSNRLEQRYEDTMAYLKAVVLDLQEEIPQYTMLAQAVARLYGDIGCHHSAQFIYNTEVIYGRIG